MSDFHKRKGRQSRFLRQISCNQCRTTLARKCVYAGPTYLPRHSLPAALAAQVGARTLHDSRSVNVVLSTPLWKARCRSVIEDMIIMLHDLCRGMRHAHLHCWRMPRLPRSGQSPGASVRLISSSWPIPRGLWPAAHSGQAISGWRASSMLMEARRGRVRVACNDSVRIVSIARTPMCIEQRWLANDIIDT